MNSLTIKVYINGANANQGKLILNNVEYPFDNVMPGSDNDYEYYFYFDNPITLPVTGQLFITNPSDDIVPFDHNGTIQVNQGYGIWNYDTNNPCYMEFELEQDGQAYGDPSIEFGSVSNPWYYNRYVVSSCNTPTTYTITTSVTGQGTISGINNPYTSGDTATLTATPDPDSQFIYWYDNDNDQGYYDNPWSFTVDRNWNIDAIFAGQPPVETYTISGSISGQGTMSGQGTYMEGDNVTLTATPASGWEFERWFDTDNREDYYDNPLTIEGLNRDWDIVAIFVENTPTPTEPDLRGRYYFNSQINYFIFFSTNYSLVFGECGSASAYSYEWLYTDHWSVTLDLGGETIYLLYDENTDTFELTGDVFTYSSTDPCGGSTPYSVTIVTEGQGTVDGIHSGDQTGQYYLTAIPDQGWVFDHWTISGWDTQDNPLDTSFPDAHQTVYVYFVQEGPGPQPTEKHIYLCDNSGAHLAEMTKTGSTWSVSGAFTSGMYSIRATVEGEYEDAWFKFYQTSGDNRIFVGAGDDPTFEDIGTYIMIDDILTSFSLTEDQTTGYYVVNYQNTDAMTTSMVDTIVNSYIGDFVTGSDIAEMGYMTATDISSMSYVDSTSLSAMSYITMTDVQSLGYLTQSDISNMSYITMTDVQGLGYVSGSELVSMSYVDSTSLSNMGYLNQSDISSMSYVNNSYLSTYMNNVVGNIESILQTI